MSAHDDDVFSNHQMWTSPRCARENISRWNFNEGWEAVPEFPLPSFSPTILNRLFATHGCSSGFYQNQLFFPSHFARLWQNVIVLAFTAMCFGTTHRKKKRTRLDVLNVYGHVSMKCLHSNVHVLIVDKNLRWAVSTGFIGSNFVNGNRHTKCAMETNKKLCVSCYQCQCIAALHTNSKIERCCQASAAPICFFFFFFLFDMNMWATNMNRDGFYDLQIMR